MINTNLIIGRLGSGKTTCIKHLINNIPKNEYWAIIVNEFGQVGIDSALLSGQEDNSLSVTEINGGCICCAAQSKLRVTLTSLIRKHKPDRIIIEATGLGHPAGIIDLLRDEFLQAIIKIDSIITVIDISLFEIPYNPNDEKSPLTTESFNQQTQLADIIILNKDDLSKQTNTKHAQHYLGLFYPKKSKTVSTKYGVIDLNLLTLPSKISQKDKLAPPHSKHYSSRSGTFSAHNIQVDHFFSESDEYISFGYIFPDNLIFSRKKLQQLFKEYITDTSFEVVRLKAVFNCGRFWQAFNYTDRNFDIDESYYRRDSRIELISKNKAADINSFTESLLLCANIAPPSND